MKEFLKKIIIKIITWESRLVLARFRPKIIAVVGSVGKTSTKDAVYSGLKNILYIRKNQKSFNSEIGVPLTILGLANAWGNYGLWFWNVIRGFLTIFSFNYPKWLILELGIDRPGDMKKYASWIKPDVVILTSFPDVPVHVEYFESPEDVIAEKKEILKSLKYDGALVLNADDPKVFAVAEEMKSKIKKVVTFGLSTKADVSISNMDVIYENFDNHQVPTGVSFKGNYNGNSVPIALHGALGVQHIYPMAAAMAAALVLDLPILSVVDALHYHQVPKGRMNIIEAINNSVLIDDSYNASPESMSKAIEVLGQLETNSSKIAILGDMLEIGKYTVREHRRIGEMVKNQGINFLFAIGLRSKDMALAAVESGMSEDHVFHFDSSEEAIETVLKYIKPYSLILIKGSQGARMEKISGAIIKDQDNKDDLLVRQEGEWERR